MGNRKRAELGSPVSAHARLIEAADEARRGLERDLHDGAQEQLAVAALTLRRAASQARGTAAEPLVAEASEYLHRGLAELGEVARRIHPPVLSERGLAPALEGLVARSPFPVELNVTASRVPSVLETAIYLTVAEALADVTRQASASRAKVCVEIARGDLVAEVVHDGLAGPDIGAGLQRLADRLHALGGSLTVLSRRGSGTTVRACAPLPAGPDG